jgi:hypothetical protein
MIASLFHYDRYGNVGPPRNNERAARPPDLAATHNERFTTSLSLELSLTRGPLQPSMHHTGCKSRLSIDWDILIAPAVRANRTADARSQRPVELSLWFALCCT